jgi:hypothetical protein
MATDTRPVVSESCQDASIRPSTHMIDIIYSK